MATTTMRQQVMGSHMFEIIDHFLIESNKSDDKGKRKDTPIAPQLSGLFDEAHNIAKQHLQLLPAQLEKYTSNGQSDILWKVQQYKRIYAKLLQLGDVHKLEVLTVSFGVIGAVDLFYHASTLDAMVAYCFRNLINRNVGCEVKIIEVIVVRQGEHSPSLIPADSHSLPFVDITRVYQLYESNNERSWRCSTYGWIVCEDDDYQFLLTRSVMSSEDVMNEIIEMNELQHNFYAGTKLDAKPIAAERVIEIVIDNQ